MRLIRCSRLSIYTSRTPNRFWTFLMECTARWSMFEMTSGKTSMRFLPIIDFA